MTCIFWERNGTLIWAWKLTLRQKCYINSSSSKDWPSWLFSSARPDAHLVDLISTRSSGERPQSQERGSKEKNSSKTVSAANYKLQGSKSIILPRRLHPNVFTFRHPTGGGGGGGGQLISSSGGSSARLKFVSNSEIKISPVLWVASLRSRPNK